MRSASPALTNFLLNIQDRVPGTPGNFAMEDLYVVATGTAQIAVNVAFKPSSGGLVTVTPPSIGNTAGVFISDVCVRQALDYSPVTFIPSGSPAIGQYTVNNSTGVYTFNTGDVAGKLITYVFSYGIVAPVVQFWTSGGLSIQFGSNLYSALGPFINRCRIKTGLGLSVDNVEITLAARPDMVFPATATSIIQGFVQGIFDGAAFLVHRIIMPTYNPANIDTSLGAIVWFKGTVADATEIGRSHVKFDVRSRLELLNQPLPKNLLQPSCRHVLFDAGCTLSAAAFTSTGALLTGSNKSMLITNLTQAPSTPGPTSAPTLSTVVPSSGVNLTERTEFAVVTYVTALGESLPSPEAFSSFGVITNAFITDGGAGYVSAPSVVFSGGGGSGAAATATVANGQVIAINVTHIGSGYTTAPTITIGPPPAGTGNRTATAATSIAGIPGNAELVVHSPPSATGAIGWNCYIGLAPGEEMLQNSTPIPIGTNFTEANTGPVTGSPPPILATNGYFSQGVITFLTGPNAGISREVTTYVQISGQNVLTIIPPLPNTPMAGDTFSIVPGCDKNLTTCGPGVGGAGGKFSNGIHFGGFPFIPDPSQTV